MVNPISESEQEPPLGESVRAEAAVWVARLHSDARSAATEAGFRRWLASSPAHRAAFERMTALWDSTANLRREELPRQGRVEFWSAVPRAAATSAATLLVCMLIVVAGHFLMRSPAKSGSESFAAVGERFATAIGERRSWTLSDGSHMLLDTDSQVRVALSSHTRRVILEQGRARFDVAHDPAAPFFVLAGGMQVLATGTAFDVRWTDRHLSVVLAEGRVAILSAAVAPTAAALRSAVTLEPGERLDFETPTLAVKSAARLDRDEAWMTGRVIFESTPVSSAIAEMNRYTRRPLKLANTTLANRRITGTFAVNDSTAFAHAVAQTFSLTVSAEPDAIVLGRSPR